MGADDRPDLREFDSIDFRGAAERIRGVLKRTPLLPFDMGDARIDLRLKLENRQINGAFKSRGAWNQMSQLSEAQAAAGVVASSSGNHGGALSWAAERAGVPATIVMPENAYPNKIEGCRRHGARVVLMPTRQEAEEETMRLVREGATLVHPYDAARTVEGAGTVGLEIAEQWPQVEVVVVPVGGGGLLAGTSLALRRELGWDLVIVGAEPAGAPSMKKGLAAGKPVDIDPITTGVQGLCPMNSGAINISICSRTVDSISLMGDPEIFAAQARLVQAGEVVEPAGAAAPACVFSERLPQGLLRERSAQNPLRVVAVISGGNPDPAQLEEIRRSV